MEVRNPIARHRKKTSGHQTIERKPSPTIKVLGKYPTIPVKIKQPELCETAELPKADNICEALKPAQPTALGPTLNQTLFFSSKSTPANFANL